MQCVAFRLKIDNCFTIPACGIKQFKNFIVIKYAWTVNLFEVQTSHDQFAKYSTIIVKSEVCRSRDLRLWPMGNCFASHFVFYHFAASLFALRILTDSLWLIWPDMGNYCNGPNGANGPPLGTNGPKATNSRRFAALVPNGRMDVKGLTLL